MEEEENPSLDDDFLNPSDEVDLDEYDIVSLMGVGTVIVVLGALIGFAARKNPKRFSNDSGAEEALMRGNNEDDNQIRI